MIRTLNVVARDVTSVSRPPVVLAAAVAGDVIPANFLLQEEIVYIELFNSGANNAYYNFGAECDNLTNYNAYLVPGQMLEVPVRQRVSMYSVAGTTISITVIKRVTALSSLT